MPRSSGPPELIRAEPGPYKVKPPNPGGLDITGESQTAFETSAGEDKDSQLDLSKVPEEPVAKPVKQPPRPASAVERDQGRRSRPSPNRPKPRARPAA